MKITITAAAVAAGAGRALDTVEEQCTGLTRREQFLRLVGTKEWPDGTVAAPLGTGAVERSWARSTSAVDRVWTSSAAVTPRSGRPQVGHARSSWPIGPWQSGQRWGSA